MRFTRSQTHAVNLNQQFSPDDEKSRSQPSIPINTTHSSNKSPQPHQSQDNNSTANSRLRLERRRLAIDSSGSLAIDKAVLPRKRKITTPSRSLSDSLPSVSVATRMKIGIRKQRVLRNLRSAHRSDLQNSDALSPQSAAASDDSQATILMDSLPPLPNDNEPSPSEHVANEQTAHTHRNIFAATRI